MNGKGFLLREHDWAYIQYGKEGKGGESPQLATLRTQVNSLKGQRQQLLSQTQRLAAISNRGINFNASIHRPRMHHQCFAPCDFQALWG